MVSVPDIAIVVFVAAFLIRGYVRGFFRETFSVVAFGIAILLTMQFSDAARPYLAYALGESDSLDSLAKPLIFLTAWVLTAWFFRMMFGFLSIETPGLFSRLSGGLIGCAKGVLFFALGLVALEEHAPDYLPPAGGGDRLLPYIRPISDYIKEFDKADIREGLNTTREKLDEKLDSGKEGVGTVKKKLEGLTGGEREEAETNESKQ